VHPALLAAALRHRCQAGILLQLLGAGEAFALVAEGGQRSWCQDRSTAGSEADIFEYGQAATSR
jgi:hypothetical protein